MFGANVLRLLKNIDASVSALTDLPPINFVSIFPLDSSLFFEQQTLPIFRYVYKFDYKLFLSI
jgi:hypothetical protein